MSPPAEQTVSTFIIHKQRVLLLRHKKFGTWMPAGGHLEEGETPAQGAIREAREETGLEIEFLGDERLTLNLPYVQSFPRPYLCMAEDPTTISSRRPHIVFVYVARPISCEVVENGEETEGFHWFSQEEVDQLDNREIFEDIPIILNQIFSDLKASRLSPIEFSLPVGV